MAGGSDINHCSDIMIIVVVAMVLVLLFMFTL